MRRLVLTMVLVVAPALAGAAVSRLPGGRAHPQRANVLQQSNTISTGTAYNSPWSGASTPVTTVAGFPDGKSNWAEVTSSVATATTSQTPTIPAAKEFALSATMRKASGSGYAGLWTGCGAAVPTSCVCWRDDGGSCSAAVKNTNFCSAEMSSLGVVPVRLFLVTYCNAATTTPLAALVPGQHGTATGTARFGGVQLEVGSTVTPLIVTTTASARRPGRRI